MTKNTDNNPVEEFVLAERLKGILTDETVEGVKWIVHVKPVVMAIKNLMKEKKMPQCCQKEISEVVVGVMMKYCYKPGP